MLAPAIRSSASVLVTDNRRDFGRLFGKIAQGVAIMTFVDALARAIGTPDPRR